MLLWMKRHFLRRIACLGSLMSFSIQLQYLSSPFIFMRMRNLTKGQVIGLKFELFLTGLLKSLGYQNVLHNVEYHTSRYVFRQADVSYTFIEDKRAYLVLVEAKFSSGGPIHNHFRQKAKHKASQLQGIESLIDEVAERQAFCSAAYSVLATNKGFDFTDKERQYAKEKRINLLEGNRLEGIYHGSGGKGSIDSAIYSLGIRGRCHKNIIYL